MESFATYTQYVSKLAQSLTDRDWQKLDETGKKRWLALCASCLLLFLISIAFHYALFTHLDPDGVIADEDTPVALPALNQKNVERLLAIYKEREKLFEATLTTSSRVVDPSL